MNCCLSGIINQYWLISTRWRCYLKILYINTLTYLYCSWTDYFLKIIDFVIICSNIVLYKMVFRNTYSVLLSEWKDKLRLIFTPQCHIRTFTRHKRLNHFLGFRWRWTLCFDVSLQWYHLFYAIQPVLSNMLIGSNQDVMSPDRSIFKSHSKSTSTWRKQLYN